MLSGSRLRSHGTEARGVSEENIKNLSWGIEGASGPGSAERAKYPPRGDTEKTGRDLILQS